MRPNVQIDRELCQACERCQARSVCRTRAILQLEPADLPVVEADRCRGCLVCVAACPYGAVTGPASARGHGVAAPPG